MVQVNEIHLIDRYRDSFNSCIILSVDYPKIPFLLNVIWACKISIEMRVYVNLHFSYLSFYLSFSVSLAISMIRYQLYSIISLAVMFAAVYTVYLLCT